MLSAVGSLAIAGLTGELPFENPGLGLFILVMSLSGTFGLGFAFAALTLWLKETASTVANLLQFFFLIFTANFFPFSALPDFLLPVAKALPLAYSVDAFRSTLMGYPEGFPELAPINTEIIIVTIFGLLMPLVGAWLYRRAEDAARAKGSLAAY